MVIHWHQLGESTCLHDCLLPVTTFLGTTCPGYNNTKKIRLVLKEYILSSFTIALLAF